MLECGPKLVANPEHLALLQKGVEVWNASRPDRPDLHRAILNRSNLTGANLSGANLNGADLSDTFLNAADLSGANLFQANLFRANLNAANLFHANLYRAMLFQANLSAAKLFQANLGMADLRRADLSGADLAGANLAGANLAQAQLVETNLVDATLTDCRIYGISAWDPKLGEGTQQNGLVITRPGEPEVTVDDLEVAQFVYLILHNEKLRKVIDTITSKVVLILGRFSLPERKTVLDALRGELRKRNYVPVVFDFEKPRGGTTINTVTLLARMARFVIADISDAKSVLMELQAIVSSSPKLPVLPIIVTGQNEPGMFNSFDAYPWFLNVYTYENSDQLLVDLKDRVIGPLEDEVGKLRGLA